MTREILRAIVDGYALEPDGLHGLEHWGRVYENGSRLAGRTGADVELVRWFALFHDCRRINDDTDPDHGLRGADFAETLRGDLLHLDDDRFELLRYACVHHTDGETEADPTIQTCWDADRLDLGRVWVTPDPRFLCTEAAKDPKMIAWADGRARERGNGHVTPCAEQWYAWTR